MTDVNITITDEREAALQLSLASSYPDDKARPSFAEFAAEVANAKYDEHVREWALRKQSEVQQKVLRHVAKFTTEDIAALAAVVEKYEPPKDEEPAPVEEIASEK